MQLQTPSTRALKCNACSATAWHTYSSIGLLLRHSYSTKRLPTKETIPVRCVHVSHVGCALMSVSV